MAVGTIRDGLPPDGAEGVFLGHTAGGVPHLMRWDGRGWVAVFFAPSGTPTGAASYAEAGWPVIVKHCEVMP
jgi:hypothetical protein